MSKYGGNPKLLCDLKGVTKNIVNMAVSSAYWNLKLSKYYLLGSHTQIKDQLKNDVNDKI
jgi:hypothetical protein